MDVKICRLCRINQASSKEHLIANSRLKTLNDYKENSETNDNIQKTYKKITCESCNNSLGEYERIRWCYLAYATVWKLLAGNLNSAFDRQRDFILENSSFHTIDMFEKFMADLIRSKNILPLYTFKFSLDPMKSELENKFGFAKQQVKLKAVGENDDPISSGTFFTQDKGGGEKEKGYIAAVNKNGSADLSILSRIEIIRIVKHAIEIQVFNEKSKEKIDFDIIVYVSLDGGGHRLLLGLPLISMTEIGSGQHISKSFDESFFLPIFKKCLPELEIISIEKYF